MHANVLCFQDYEFETHYIESTYHNFYPFDSFLGKGGLGSTKFVAFETLAWHNECFFCNICKDSMVGKGFIQVNIHFQELESTRMLFKSRLWETEGEFYFQDGENIICPECARKKMMEEIEAE